MGFEDLEQILSAENLRLSHFGQEAGTGRWTCIVYSHQKGQVDITRAKRWGFGYGTSLQKAFDNSLKDVKTPREVKRKREIVSLDISLEDLEL